MLIKRPPHIPSSEITPERIYHQRRRFIGNGALLAMGAAAGGMMPGLASAAEGDALRARAPEDLLRVDPAEWWEPKFDNARPAPGSGPFTTDENLTPFIDVTRYNNFYEFGMNKTDPFNNAQSFEVDPWSVSIEGEVAKPGTYALEDILRPHTLEERIYRLRCVEAWSMVIPWVGFPLADLIRRFEPTSKARYVEFTTLVDPEQMPGQRSRTALVDWPYREGLRMDEAMNPLTLLAVGLYGDVLPAQNGAPLRLVVPWKYGFKSIKSIVSINFREDQPSTTWNDLAANEYGFYANVNPNVSHPRWSQATERRLPQPLFGGTRRTEMFNGYGEQVASMYEGMDLSRYY